MADSLNNLAGIVVKQGRPAEGEALYAEAVRIGEATLPTGHWRVAAFRGNWGGVLTRLERFDEAEVQLLKSYEDLAAARGTTHPRSRHVVALICELYEATDSPEKAAVWQARRADAEEEPAGAAGAN